MIRKTILLELGDRSYPIYAGTDMVASFAPTCLQHKTTDAVVLITDRTVAALYKQPLLNNLIHHAIRPLTIVLPPGETRKTLQTANHIFSEMLKERIPRNAAIIALGGGVIGDLAGFVAATYQRGIRLVHVPTTLLAQVDSSIGGKVGVNHSLGKNMIGAFYQPVFVWADAEYLSTLPKREVVCGLGEVVKYGLISDRALFGFIEEHLEELLRAEPNALAHVQSRCAEIKADIVRQDEREAGIRAILNCGHTVGHGLESAGKYRALKHGEAVLLGMIAEAFIAKELGLFPADAYARLTALIHRIPLNTGRLNLAPRDILDAMGRDKKRIGSRLRFVVPTAIGAVRAIDSVEPALIRASLKEIFKKR